jgi:hypothetical protein
MRGHCQPSIRSCWLVNNPLPLSSLPLLDTLPPWPHERVPASKTGPPGRAAILVSQTSVQVFSAQSATIALSVSYLYDSALRDKLLHSNCIWKSHQHTLTRDRYRNGFLLNQGGRNTYERGSHINPKRIWHAVELALAFARF